MKLHQCLSWFNFILYCLHFNITCSWFNFILYCLHFNITCSLFYSKTLNHWHLGVIHIEMWSTEFYIEKYFDLVTCEYVVFVWQKIANLKSSIKEKQKMFQNGQQVHRILFTNEKRIKLLLLKTYTCLKSCIWICSFAQFWYEHFMTIQLHCISILRILYFIKRNSTWYLNCFSLYCYCC